VPRLLCASAMRFIDPDRAGRRPRAPRHGGPRSCRTMPRLHSASTDCGLTENCRRDQSAGVVVMALLVAEHAQEVQRIEMVRDFGEDLRIDRLAPIQDCPFGGALPPGQASERGRQIRRSRASLNNNSIVRRHKQSPCGPHSGNAFLANEAKRALRGRGREAVSDFEKKLQRTRIDWTSMDVQAIASMCDSTFAEFRPFSHTLRPQRPRNDASGSSGPQRHSTFTTS